MLQAISWFVRVCCVLLLAAAHPAGAQAPAPPEEPSVRVRLLLDLLADSEVQAWLAEQRKGRAAQGEEAAGTTPAGYVAEQINAMRANLRALGNALPRVGPEFERAGNILALEFEEHGLSYIALLIGIFVALGFGAEWLFRRATAGFRDWIGAIALDSVAGRLRAVAARLAFGIGLLAAFAAGSIGAFLAFEWPPCCARSALATCWPSWRHGWRWSLGGSCSRRRGAVCSGMWSASASCR